MDEQFARNIARLGGRYNGAEAKGSSFSGLDEEEQTDTSLWEGAALRMTASRLQERDHAVAVAEHKKAANVLQTHEVRSRCGSMGTRP